VWRYGSLTPKPRIISNAKQAAGHNSEFSMLVSEVQPNGRDW
jgi:hypothetical protein